MLAYEVLDLLPASSVPQLDIVSFFNQIVWLTVVFVLLLTSFYSCLLRPYNRLLMLRKSLIRILESLKPDYAALIRSFKFNGRIVRANIL